MTKEVPVGFAATSGKPVVVFPHRLLAVESVGEVSALASFKPLSGVLVSPTGLRLATPDGLLSFGDKGLESAAHDGFVKGAMLSQSGTVNAAQAVQHGPNTEIGVWTAKGTRLPLIAITGKLEQISWTPAGLATIVDDALFTLNSGDSKVHSTPADPAFKTAIDLCMVGPSRAVVMFPHTAVLYDHGLRTILAAIPGGRCSWSGENLFMLDAKDGLIWKVDNIAAVGDRLSTLALMEQLTAKSKAQDEAGTLAFRELARLVGFDQASTLTGRPNPCPVMTIPTPPQPAPKGLKTRPQTSGE